MLRGIWLTLGCLLSSSVQSDRSHTWHKKGVGSIPELSRPLLSAKWVSAVLPLNGRMPHTSSRVPGATHSVHSGLYIGMIQVIGLLIRAV